LKVISGAPRRSPKSCSDEGRRETLCIAARAGTMVFMMIGAMSRRCDA